MALARAFAIRYSPPGAPVRLLVCSLHGDAKVACGADERLQPPAGTCWRTQLDSRPMAGRTAGVSVAVNVLVFDQPATVLLVARPNGAVD